MICWKIWKNRNIVRQGRAGKKGYQVLKMALNQVEEYMAAHDEALPQRDKEEICWTTPMLYGGSGTRNFTLGIGKMVHSERA